MGLTPQDIEVIANAKRHLRFIWQQGFTARFDALEHDALFDCMQGLDDLHFRATARPIHWGANRPKPSEKPLSESGQTLLATDVVILAEKAHACEHEGICGYCGARSINGRCSNQFCG